MLQLTQLSRIFLGILIFNASELGILPTTVAMRFNWSIYLVCWLLFAAQKVKFSLVKLQISLQARTKPTSKSKPRIPSVRVRTRKWMRLAGKENECQALWPATAEAINCACHCLNVPQLHNQQRPMPGSEFESPGLSPLVTPIPLSFWVSCGRERN